MGCLIILGITGNGKNGFESQGKKNVGRPSFAGCVEDAYSLLPIDQVWLCMVKKLAGQWPYRTSHFHVRGTQSLVQASFTWASQMFSFDFIVGGIEFVFCACYSNPSHCSTHLSTSFSVLHDFILLIILKPAHQPNHLTSLLLIL